MIGLSNHYQTWDIDWKTWFEYFGKKISKVFKTKMLYKVWIKKN